MLVGPRFTRQISLGVRCAISTKHSSPVRLNGLMALSSSFNAFLPDTRKGWSAIRYLSTNRTGSSRDSNLTTTQSHKSQNKTVVVTGIPKSSYGLILGKGGERISRWKSTPGISNVFLNQGLGQINIWGPNEAAVSAVEAEIKELMAKGYFKVVVVTGVPKSSYGLIVGKGGDMLARLKAEPGILDVVLNQASSKLTIRGSNDAAVSAVEAKIKGLLQRADDYVKVVEGIPRDSFGHIVGRKAGTIAALRQEPGISSVLLDEDRVRVIIRGSNEAAVSKVEAEIKELMETQTNTCSKVVGGIPRELFGLIVGKGGGTIAALRGEPGILSVELNEGSGEVRIRGSSKTVVSKLEAKIKELVQTVHIKVVGGVPKESYSILIGEKGRRITKWRSESGISSVHLNSDSGEVSIRGSSEEAVSKVEAEIKEQIQKWHNLTSCSKVVSGIPKGAYSLIIGKGGNVMNKLKREPGITGVTLDQDEGTVKILGASEAAVSSVEARINEIVQSWQSLNSYSSVVSGVPKLLYGTVIGKGGKMLDRWLKQPNISSIILDENSGEVIIGGSSEAAVKGVESNIKELVDSWHGMRPCTKVVGGIPKAMHRHFIGKGGEVMGLLEGEPGISSVFLDGDSSEMSIWGTSDAAVSRVEMKIKELVHSWSAQNTNSKVVGGIPKGAYRLIIGKGGEMIGRLEQEPGISSVYLDQKSGEVSIWGSSEAAVSRVEAKIKELVQLWSNTSSISKVVGGIPRALFGVILGEGGETMHAFRQQPGISSVILDENVGELRITGCSEAAVSKVEVFFKDLVQSWHTTNCSKVVGGIPRALYGAIIGKKGETLTNLEKDPGISNITLNKDTGEVIIWGSSEAAVSRVEAQIKELLHSWYNERRHGKEVEGIPREKYSRIIGRGGEMLAKLQGEPGILQVYLDQDSGVVSIWGCSEEAVSRVETKIREILNKGTE